MKQSDVNMHLLIVGDSITLGVAEITGDRIISRVKRSYVDHLQEAFPAVRITVSADIHRTTADAANGLDELVANLRPDIVLLMIGGNDADLNWRRFLATAGRVCVNVAPIERYTENMRRILAHLAAAGVVPIMTDMPSQNIAVRGSYIAQLCNKDVPAMLQAAGGQQEADGHVDGYRKAALAVAEEARVELIRYGEALSLYPLEEVIGVDGAHPNDRAHEIIAQMLHPVLVAHAKHPRSRSRSSLTPHNQ